MKFFRQPKNIIICTLILVGLFFALMPAQAALIDSISDIVGNIVAGLVWITGRVLVTLMHILIWVASYNDFVNSTAVTSGWVIVRDVCNMFFILILLVIAFTTVLNVPGYSWKSMLPRMLLMAVLINFSKLICGVIIDFAQVIMLTFVNGFRDIGGGNLTDMLGINKLLDLGNGSEQDVSSLSIMGTYVLALAYIIIATAVIVIILFVLIMRMVMLWILVTLSPLAYLLSALPNTKSYASKWWSQFTDNVVSGPILAFFIWLSFTSATADVTNITTTVPKPGTGANEQIAIEAISKDPSAGLSTAGTAEGMLKFIISIGMLIGGLMITKQLSGSVGSIAGKGLSKIEGGAKALKNFGINSAKTMGKNTGRVVGQTALRSVGATTRFAGNKISEKTGGQFGASLQKSGQFLNSWGGDIRKSRKDAKYKKRKETLEKMGMKADTMDALHDASKTALGRSFKGALVAGTGLATGNPFLMAAGISHALAASNKDHIGGGIKNIAAGIQKDSDLRVASKEYSRLKEGLSEGYLLKDEEHDKLEANRKTEINGLDAEKEKEFAEARESGKNNNLSNEDIEANIKRIEDSYKAKVETINDHYKQLADKADAHYENAASQDELLNNSALHEKYQSAKKVYSSARTAVDAGKVRDSKVASLYKQEGQQLQSISLERDQKLKYAEANYGGVAREVKIKEAKDEHKLKEKDIRASFNKKRDQVQAEYQKTNEEARENMTDYDAIAANFLGDGVKKWETNRLTIEGAKLGSKEVKESKDFVRNILLENFSRSKPNMWSVMSGIDGKQKKIYKNLASTPEGKEAVKKLVEDLNAINNAGTVSKHADKIEALKKGVAYSNHEDHTEGGLKDLIEVLNKIDTKHKKGWIKVPEFGPKEHDDHKEEEHKEEKTEHHEPATGSGTSSGDHTKH